VDLRQAVRDALSLQSPVVHTFSVALLLQCSVAASRPGRPGVSQPLPTLAEVRLPRASGPRFFSRIRGPTKPCVGGPVVPVVHPLTDERMRMGVPRLLMDRQGVRQPLRCADVRDELMGEPMPFGSGQLMR